MCLKGEVFLACDSNWEKVLLALARNSVDNFILEVHFSAIRFLVTAVLQILLKLWADCSRTRARSWRLDFIYWSLMAGKKWIKELLINVMISCQLNTFQWHCVRFVDTESTLYGSARQTEHQSRGHCDCHKKLRGWQYLGLLKSITSVAATPPLPTRQAIDPALKMLTE